MQDITIINRLILETTKDKNVNLILIDRRTNCNDERTVYTLNLICCTILKELKSWRLFHPKVLSISIFNLPNYCFVLLRLCLSFACHMVFSLPLHPLPLYLAYRRFPSFHVKPISIVSPFDTCL